MLILRPASWLALLSRTFTFELSLTGSPQANVEYDYVGKQSIPTTGLSPASPTALWAAELGLTPRRPWRGRDAHQGLAGGARRVGGWGGAARGVSAWDGPGQAKRKRPQDRCLRPLRRTMEGHPCPSSSRLGIHVARNKPRTYVGKIAQAREDIANSEKAEAGRVRY